MMEEQSGKGVRSGRRKLKLIIAVSLVSGVLLLALAVQVFYLMFFDRAWRYEFDDLTVRINFPIDVDGELRTGGMTTVKISGVDGRAKTKLNGRIEGIVYIEDEDVLLLLNTDGIIYKVRIDGGELLDQWKSIPGYRSALLMPTEDGDFILNDTHLKMEILRVSDGKSMGVFESLDSESERFEVESYRNGYRVKDLQEGKEYFFDFPAHRDSSPVFP